MLDASLITDLVRLFRRGLTAPLYDAEFDAWAVRVFRYQYTRNTVYSRYCRARGVTPERVRRWTDIPPVPTAGFKELALLCGEPEEAEALFETSGTTGGAQRRGRHYVLSLTLYDEALLPNFRANLLPDDVRLPMLALVPAPARAPSSSLSYMVGRAMECFGAPGSRCLADPEGGIPYDTLHAAVDGYWRAGEPIALLGTAFAFVHWLDRLEKEGRRFALPPGSRIMETGGFKGRSRTVGRDELYDALHERFGVRHHHIVNEYGMTEMLSQFYEPVLRESRERGPLRRRHVPPPWVRTRVVDPASLEPLAPGEAGILHHFDLANAGAVASILTEDLALASGDGFRLLGRVEGAEPRGCSIAMDELLTARAAAGERSGP
ncbi:MAG: long-chain fatty acid--CoA ligase [Gemmatimonadetes bacterium]|nr:long-chain fatty acid--CoA ligase [Gemmatimonadota bacterium]